MNVQNKKYTMLLTLLRSSKPVLNTTDDIVEEVLKRVPKNTRRGIGVWGVIDFIFAWIYIGWVRRVLITASVSLVLVFIVQQVIILKQINFLSRQTVLNSIENTTDQSGELGKKLMMYKLSGHRFGSRSITISEKQMDQLLDSVNELQNKYKDLIKLIEDDPELKKSIEKKLIENNRVKINN